MHTISRRRRLAAILLLPFMLLLAGCGRMVGEFEVRDVDTMFVSLDYALDTSVIEELNTYGSDMGETPEEFCGLTEEQVGDWGEVTPEAYEEDGMWGCRIEGQVERADFGSGIELTEEDGEFHFVIEGTSTGVSTDMTYPGLEDFEFSFTISFPGQVIDSANGTIDGNSVVFTDIDEFNEGVDIRAEAGGFPWIIVIIAVVVIGFFLLLAIAAAAFFFIRSRNTKNSTGGTGGGTNSSAPAAPAAFGAAAGSPGFGQSPPAAPQPASPMAPPQGSPVPPQQDSQGQQWGQGQPSPAAPQQPDSDQQWGQQPPAPGGQPSQQGGSWDQPGQAQPPQQQAPQQNDPWAQPGQDPQHGQQWNQQQPPHQQNPGW